VTLFLSAYQVCHRVRPIFLFEISVFRYGYIAIMIVFSLVIAATCILLPPLIHISSYPCMQASKSIFVRLSGDAGSANYIMLQYEEEEAAKVSKSV